MRGPGQRLHNAPLSRERYGKARKPKKQRSRALKGQAPPSFRPFSRPPFHFPELSRGGRRGRGSELPVVLSLRHGVRPLS